MKCRYRGMLMPHASRTSVQHVRCKCFRCVGTSKSSVCKQRTQARGCAVRPPISALSGPQLLRPAIHDYQQQHQQHQLHAVALLAERTAMANGNQKCPRQAKLAPCATWLVPGHLGCAAFGTVDSFRLPISYHGEPGPTLQPTTALGPERTNHSYEVAYRSTILDDVSSLSTTVNNM